MTRLLRACARWILAGVSPKQDREALIGDLLEEHALLARTAAPSEASRWYWRQVGASVLHLVYAAIRRGAWVKPLAVALGAYVLVGIVEFSAAAAASRLLGLEDDGYTLLDLLLAVPIVVIVAWLAARIRRGSAVALALIMLAVAATLLIVSDEGLPVWQQLAFVAVGPLAALAGGSLAAVRPPGAR